MSTTKLYDDLARVCKWFLVEEPFYGFFLLSVEKRFSTALPTAGVGPHGKTGVMLYINPDFWTKLTNEQRYVLLKHEMLHLCLFHVYLYVPQFHEQKRWNVACDTEVNQHLDTKILSSIEGGCILLEDMKQFLPQNQDLAFKGAIWYYNNFILPQQNGSGNQQGQSSKGGQGGGSGDGNQQEDGELGNDPSHSKWKEFDELTDAEKELVKSKLEATLLEAWNNTPEKSRGLLPGSIAGTVEKLLKNKQFFNWKSFIKSFVGGSTEVYTKRTRYRESKRFEDTSAIKVKKRKKILVALDTSGSVSKDELIEFLSVVHTIHHSGSEVDIIQCDAQLAKEIIPYKRNLQELLIYGRGGTIFDPPIQFLNEHSNEYVALIYFTDGEAPCPDIRPVKPVLWVLSPQTRCTPESMSDFFGKVIKIPADV